MSFPIGLVGLWSARRFRPRRPDRVRRRPHRSWLEPLESRRLLATLDIAGTTVAPSGPLTFSSGSSASGLLTVSISGSSYTFTDPAESIFLTGTAAQAGWTGNGSNSVTGPVSSATSILIDPVDTGSTIDLQDTQAPTTIQPQNGGAIPVTVGGDPTLGLGGIAAPVTVANPLGSIALTVDDSANASPVDQSMTIGATSMTYMSGNVAQAINYANLTALTVDGSTSANATLNNFYNVDATPANSTVTLNAGADPTSVAVYGTGAASTLNIQGQGATENVSINTVNPGGPGTVNGVVNVANTGGFTGLAAFIGSSTAALTPTISGTQLTGVVPATINYVAADLSVLFVTSQNAGNTFTITNTPAGAQTQIYSNLATSTDADTINVQGTSGPLALMVGVNVGTDNVLVGNAGSLANINGGVNLATSPAGTGSIALTLDDSADATATTATISATAITGLAPAAINYGPFFGGFPTQINSLTIDGGSGGNTFTIADTPASTVLNTGTGSNPITVAGTTQPLTINDQTTAASPDVITVGNAGNAQGINGLVTVNGSPTLTQLTVDDSADPTGRDVTLTASLLAVSAASGILGGLTPQPILFNTGGLDLLTVHTGTGTNALTVDFSNGNPLPATSGLDYNGGTGSNTLNLQGGSFANEDYSANGPGAGSINLFDSSTFQATAINFTGLKPINDTSPSNSYSFDAPATAGTVNVVDGPVIGGAHTTQINGVSANGGPAFELVNFANKANVFVNTTGMQGQPFLTPIVVNNPTQAAGLTSLTINPGPNNSTVTLNATPANVATVVNAAPNGVVNVAATGLGAGSTFTADSDGTPYTANVDAGGEPVRVASPSTGDVTVDVGSEPTIDLAPSVTQVTITNAADQPLSGALPTLLVSPTGVLANAVVGSFTDSDPVGQPINFSADINWGDGTPDTPGTIIQTGGPGTAFNVVGSHTFVGGGVFPVVITVTDHGNTGTQTLGGVPVTITDLGGSQALTGSVVESPIIATAGVPFTRTVASFIPPNGQQIPPGAVVATINWGDGTTPSTATGTAGTFPNSINIVASHTYAAAGTYTINVTAAALGFSVPFQLSAIVTAPTDVLTGTGTTIGATAAQAFTAPVATFTDSNPSIPASGFTALIEWGDGTSSVGSVTGMGGGVGSVGPSGGFTVVGSHTYADAGTFPIVTLVTENPPGAARTQINSTAIVTAPPDVLTGTGTTIGATAAQAFTNPVATFTDSNRAIPASGFTALIDWGDGTSDTPGTVTGANGVFQVIGSHTYADAGAFPIVTTLSENPPGTAATVIHSTALVSPAPVFTGVTLTLAAGQPFTESVGTFTDTITDPLAAEGPFVATIDWGDGTSPTPGTVTATGTNTYEVLGSHTYTDNGSFNIGVTVIDPLQRRITGNSTALVGLVVTNTLDADVPGSLRHVLNVANSIGGGSIRFDIPGPGPYIILVGSTTGLPLPAVTAPNVDIDATTQPGYQGKPLVVVNGTDAPAGSDGFDLYGGHDAVRGLVINGFDDIGVLLAVQGADIVQGDYIGTDYTGTSAVPNFQGVVIAGTSANLIGGVAGGNVISGNTSAGIQILNDATVFDAFDPPPAPLLFTPATANTVQHNLIGTDATGMALLGNQQGVFINDASFNLIGGDGPNTGNVIAGNKTIGLQILGDNATGNAVVGNTITDNARGVYVFAKAGNAVMQPTSNVTILPLSNGPNVETVAPVLGLNGEVGGLVVTFTTYMDRTRVENLSNYVVALLGRKNAFDPVVQAVYHNPDRAVTLTLRNPLPLSTAYQLRITGTAPNGLTDRVGPPDFLDGNLLLPRIPTGSNFAATFQGTTAIANPALTPSKPVAKAKKAPKKVKHPQALAKVSSKAVDALLAREGGIRVHRAPKRHG